MKYSFGYMLMLLFCVSTGISTSYGQAFNTFNGRNHPEIEWMEAETPHYRIMYPKHLAGIEIEAAAIAEETYTALSKGLGIEFDRKIKVYFSDEDEIVNGAATFINGSYTFIWVDLNNASEAFSSDKKWLRTVLAHELAHLFNFEALKSNMGIWGFVLGETGGRDITEGYAQYATETWNAQRGDRSLRKAIFDDKPNYYDGSTPFNGRLIYAAGFSKMLFLSEQYGDSTLRKAMAYRDTLLGPLTYPDFYKGFKESTGEKWKDFENRWQKHMNIYYNSLASQMQRTDSLHGKPVDVDENQHIFGGKISPSGKKLITVSFVSVEKPYQEIQLSERDSLDFKIKKTWILGANNGDFTWSDNEEFVYYSKMTRGKNGSLTNELFELNLKNGKERQLSFDMRMSYPAFLHDGVLLAIQNQSGTGNVVEFDINSKSIKNISRYTGDTQVLHLDVSRQKNQMAYSLFDREGARFIAVHSLKTGETRTFTSGETDDRNPRFNYDGTKVAFNSLRDHVLNIFVIDLESGTIERATHVFTGAELLDWGVSPTSKNGQWLVKSSEKKAQDAAYLVADSLRKPNDKVTVPSRYATWTTAQPEFLIPASIPVKPELVLAQKKHSPFKEITHTLSFGLPYYDEASKDYGLQGFTTWSDPLGKHLFSAIGNLSFTKKENTLGLFTYRNNTQAFSWSVDAYRIPGAFQFYNDNFLTSLLSGFSTGISKELDWAPRSYAYSRFMITTRSFLWEPFTSSIYGSARLNFSERWQNDIIAAYEIKHLLPYVHNDIHPLQGFGINLSIKTGFNADNSWFGDNQKSFAITDFRWFDVRTIWKEITFYTYFRAQAQFGSPLPFEAVQLSRYDNISLPNLAGLPLTTWNVPDRVRGYRTFVLANQLFYTTQELRLPLLPTLATQVLGGFISLDKTTAALFSDVGFANEILLGSVDKSLWQWGLGGEIKNKITLFEVLPVVQSIGYAQPYNALFSSRNADVYYRIQAVIPF